MDKLDTIRKKDMIDCKSAVYKEEWKNWNFVKEKELEFIKSDCVWRISDKFQMNTVMKDKNTNEYYMFYEMYDKYFNSYNYTLIFVEKVKEINKEYYSKYLVDIYNTVDNFTELNNLRDLLIEDWYSDSLNQIDSELIEVDLDCGNYEENIIIKIADRYFKVYLKISNSETDLLGIERVYPREKTVTVYE